MQYLLKLQDKLEVTLSGVVAHYMIPSVLSMIMLSLLCFHAFFAVLGPLNHLTLLRSDTHDTLRTSQNAILQSNLL